MYTQISRLQLCYKGHCFDYPAIRRERRLDFQSGSSSPAGRASAFAGEEEAVAVSPFIAVVEAAIVARAEFGRPARRAVVLRLLSFSRTRGGGVASAEVSESLLCDPDPPAPFIHPKIPSELRRLVSGLPADVTGRLEDAGRRSVNARKPARLSVPCLASSASATGIGPVPGREWAPESDLRCLVTYKSFFFEGTGDNALFWSIGSDIGGCCEHCDWDPERLKKRGRRLNLLRTWDSGACGGLPPHTRSRR